VAIHASLGRWDARGRRRFHSRVAVPTINSVVADVMLVTELNRLLPRHILVRKIGRSRSDQHSGERQTSQKQGRKDTESRDEVRTVVENLGHVKFALWR
jgi:hypothetical protein